MYNYKTSVLSPNASRKLPVLLIIYEFVSRFFFPGFIHAIIFQQLHRDVATFNGIMWMDKHDYLFNNDFWQYDILKFSIKNNLKKKYNYDLINDQVSKPKQELMSPLHIIQSIFIDFIEFHCYLCNTHKDGGLLILLTE